MRAEPPDEREPFTDAEVTQLLDAAAGTDGLGAILVGVWSSLRHTFVPRLAYADVSADVRKALAGHQANRSVGEAPGHWRMAIV